MYSASEKYDSLDVYATNRCHLSEARANILNVVQLLGGLPEEHGTINTDVTNSHNEIVRAIPENPWKRMKQKSALYHNVSEVVYSSYSSNEKHS